MAGVTLLRKLFVSACALTRTTNLAARWTGAAPFLPALFALRYANMGGLDRGVFVEQIRGARSFRDDRWCGYWNAIADGYVHQATGLLRALAGTESADVSDLADLATAGHLDAVADLIGPGVELFADHGPRPDTSPLAELTDRHGPTGDRIRLAYRAIDAWVKAITYYQVSAFPGHDPQRMAAYWCSRHLFDALITAMTPALGLSVERVEVALADGDIVRGYLVLPPGSGPHPVVLTTNGLEGTVAELAIPQLRYRASGLALFLMEMPGSYAYTQPMRPESEAVYHRVIEHLAADERLDAERIAMVGVSFGGYWTARLAATSDRLACAIACGAPTHRSFHGEHWGRPRSSCTPWPKPSARRTPSI